MRFFSRKVQEEEVALCLWCDNGTTVTPSTAKEHVREFHPEEFKKLEMLELRQIAADTWKKVL